MYKLDLSVKIFKKLRLLVEMFPQSVNKQFTLDHNYIFLPDEGFDKDEVNIYTLRITIHAYLIKSKLQFRKYLNQYLLEIKESIEVFLKENEQYK
jgi:hypothetical protein